MTVRVRVKPAFHGACFGADSAPILYAPYPRRVRPCLARIKPGVHTNDFATIHGRPVRIHTAPAEDNTSNQQSTPQALCEYGRADRES